MVIVVCTNRGWLTKYMDVFNSMDKVGAVFDPQYEPFTVLELRLYDDQSHLMWAKVLAQPVAAGDYLHVNLGPIVM